MTKSEQRLEFDNQVKEVQEALEKYERSVGIPKFSELECPDVVHKSLDVLRKKTPEELCEMCFELKRYSLYLTKIINEQKAWRNWAESKLKEVSGGQIKQIGDGYGWNERMLIAQTEHPLCKMINRFLREVNLKIDRLAGIPENINYVADIINNLRFEAKKREKYD